ncbi:MAG: transposase [Halobacteriota archaeon]|nr:transposase [Halobacteriota archaeon]
MIRTLKIKLEKSNDLIQTVRIFNLACQDVLDYGFENKIYNKTKLNRGTYLQIREKYPTLPSALVQTARDQASDMMKRDKFEHQIKKKELSSIRFDKRSMKVFLESEYCKLTTIFGRMQYDFKLPEYYEQYMEWEVKNAQLLVNGGCCYLHVQVESETLEFEGDDIRLGIDLGITNIAVCSDNTFYNSKDVKRVKGKYQHLKAELQSKGTRSAKRKLKKIAGRERRFVKDVNHCLAKELVEKPFDIIVFEDLTGIKKQNKGRRFNKKLGNWSFAQLQQFTEYKSEIIGKKVIYVNPKYTSQTCSKCGYRAKNNRKRSIFKCKQCGFELNADLNASRNIATFSRTVSDRLSVNEPNVASIMNSYKPLYS